MKYYLFVYLCIFARTNRGIRWDVAIAVKVTNPCQFLVPFGAFGSFLTLPAGITDSPQLRELVQPQSCCESTHD